MVGLEVGLAGSSRQKLAQPSKQQKPPLGQSESGRPGLQHVETASLQRGPGAGHSPSRRDRHEELGLDQSNTLGGVVQAGVGGLVGGVLVVAGAEPSRHVFTQPSKQHNPLSGQSGGEG